MKQLTGVLCVWALTLPAGEARPQGVGAMARVLVEQDGVYRVSDATLRAAGLAVEAADLPRLRLRLRGQEQPLLVTTSGLPAEAGRFALDFVGYFPRGLKTYEDPHNRANVYLLDLAPVGASPLRYATGADPSAAPAGVLARGASPLTVHREHDVKLMRFSGQQAPDDPWFWELTMASDAKPKTVKVNLPRVEPTRGASLRVRLQGYSSLPQQPDHYADVYWNGRPLGQAVWDGQAPFTFRAQLPAGTLLEGDNTLGFHVKGAHTGGLDVVLLDWVEVDYSQRLSLGRGGQLAFEESGKDPLRLRAAPGASVLLFDGVQRRAARLKAGTAGTLRFAPAPASPDEHAAADRLLLPTTTSPVGVISSPPPNGALPVAPTAPNEPPGVRGRTRFWAVAEGRQLPPAAVQLANPDDLRGAGRGADFVIVTHADFVKSAERLADQRRREGLKTEVVRVDDIYDQFSDGFLGPEAVREFLTYSYARWVPRPRYVLLFGDASWDYKNRSVDDANYPDHLFMPEAWNVTVPKIPATQLKPGDSSNDRQRVPTFQWQSPWGHAASDTFFAQLDGDDPLPDVALGRIPAGTVEEAEAAVDKVLAYTPQGPDGALFITDQYQVHQNESDRLAKSAAELGYGITKIYPRAEEKDNTGNSAAIREAFDAGPMLVVFAGHGGRYIWRTGPPDPVKNHDLFTLEHLDQLQPAARLPVIISLTCYSAPFDHPTADSIGEKLLRLKDKGAIAVVASSWRNVPPFSLAEHMIGDLGSGGAPRVGDAFRDAMRKIGVGESLASYNLLGDPTVPFRPPPAAAQAAGARAPAPPAAPPSATQAPR